MLTCSSIEYNFFIFFLEKLSLGDARAYYLSTAKNELGVVSAESAAGKAFFINYPVCLFFLF